MSFNMKYHNLDVVIKNLEIFKTHYTLIKSIKVNQQRGVYIVYDTIDSKNKVLKFIIKSGVNKEQQDIFRFFMNCTHRNFCRINETFEIGIFLVLVMDYVEGYTMCNYFEKPRTRVNYYKILFDLIFSLEYLHNNMIVHGDIKPNNIIIKTDGTPIIIDYDLSRFVYGDRFTKRIFGTKFFMSPELIIENKFSAKSDIWSLGMTLYVCVMKMYIPDILENILSPDNNDMMSQQKTDKEGENTYYVNQSTRNVLATIAKNNNKIRNDYGKLFSNTISVMLVEEDTSRPSSEQLSNIIQKSKYFTILYNQNVNLDKNVRGISVLNILQENREPLSPTESSDSPDSPISVSDTPSRLSTSRSLVLNSPSRSLVLNSPSRLFSSPRLTTPTKSSDLSASNKSPRRSLPVNLLKMSRLNNDFNEPLNAKKIKLIF